jgi:16S rRNA processing protein RimM
VGKITRILHLPANAAYEVERPQGDSLLIPALKSVVRRVDVANKRMEIVPLEGLLE